MYMKKTVIYLYLLLVTASLNFAQIKLRIVVTTNNIDPTEKVFITGNCNASREKILL